MPVKSNSSSFNFYETLNIDRKNALFYGTITISLKIIIINIYLFEVIN